VNFQQIYAKAESKSSYLSEMDCPKIFISSEDSTAGSDISEAFSVEVNKQGIASKVITAGSAGYYDLEPMVRIDKPGRPSILYSNVTAGTAPILVNSYLINENPMPDMALGVIGSSRMDGIMGIFELPLFKLQNRIALRNCGYIDPEDINHYILQGNGYSGLAEVLRMDPADVIAELKKSGLRGKGGAGYFTADKWQICYDAEGDEKYVICNAVDGDPHSFAAQLMLESDPHSVIEGMLIAAYTIGASRCFICVNAKYEQAIKRLRKALEQTIEYGLSGDKILDSDFSTEVVIKEEEDLFISGEETTLIRSIEGKQPMPYLRTVYPAISGINGRPTLVNNLETLSCVSAVFQNGAGWYRGFGTEESQGTKVITLSGDITHKYTVEVPFGTTLQSIVMDIGGQVPKGKNIRLVQFGGPTGAYFGADSLNIGIGYEMTKKAGSIIGSGVIEVFDSDSCAVEVVKDIIHYIHNQSCGKCVFCREGSYQIYDILKDISENKGKPSDMDLLNELCEAMATGCICGLGSTAPNPILSSIKLFSDDYEAHIKDRRCPVKDKT
jgi:NADH-quinone oxidoreductase subunit F